MTKEEAVDILIGEVYSLLDEEPDMNEDRRYALEKAVELVLKNTPEPFSRLQYRNVAAQHQVAVLLDDPRLTDEERSALQKTATMLEMITLFASTPKEIALDNMLNEALNGKSDSASE